MNTGEEDKKNIQILEGDRWKIWKEQLEISKRTQEGKESIEKWNAQMEDE